MAVCLSTIAQDYGVQIPNSNFEADWKSYSGSKQSGNEPFGWHSGMSANGSKANYMKTQIEKSSNVRPGSTGSQSVKIKCREINIVLTTIKANGTLTNGRMNAGAVSAKDADNHVYTDRSTEEFHTEINTVPDSVTIWVAFYAESSGHSACVRAAVHGDYNHIFYGDGTAKQSEEVANAITTFKRTSSSSGTLVWTRLSIPFSTEGCSSTDPQYILMNCTTNETPGSGNGGDYLMVDDAVLIYNPSLSTGTLAQTYYEGAVEAEIPIEIPFSLTGSMSVSNLNIAANQVIAQLSDANGSFDNPIEIGRVTTNTSGTISAKIPASVGDGKYKVRVVSTNYPMTAEPSSSEITVKRYYTIAFDEYDNTIAELSGDGKYYVAETENITVSAVAKADDFKFMYWYEDGTAVSLDAEYTFKAEKSRTLQAVFKKQYSVSISATNGGTVSTTGGMYGEGEGVTVTATPDEGYSFVNWTDENNTVVSTNSSYTFVVSADKTLKANFAKYVTITATTNIPGAGVITGAGDIVCSGEETEVSLYASSVNTDKYLFVNWTEDDVIVSESATYTFTTSTNRTVVANFVTRYAIDATVEDGGEVSGTGVYTEGNTVQLVAFADENYRFSGWYEADTLASTNSVFEFVANADRSFEAKFIEQCTVTLQLNIENAGVLTGAGTFDKGTEASVQIALNDGFDFTNWTVADAEVSTDLTYEFIVNESITIVANCSAIPSYTISAVSNPASGGTIAGAGTYLENKSVTLTATANSGYSFVNWTENDEVISTDASLTFSATENRSFVAYFEANFIGHTVSLIAEEGGSVSGAGLFEEGDLVTVVATPDAKYEFVNWTVNDEAVSTDASYSFELMNDIELTAHFSRIYDSFTITVASADETMGTVQGAGTYQEEDTVVVTAVPNAGYRFLQWTENGSPVSSDAEYSFVCSAEKNLVAEFKKIYTVTIDEFEGGTVKGLNTGIFDEGTTVSLAVTVDDNHRFVAWKDADSDEVLSSTVTYSFVANADKHLAVELKEKGQMYTISVSTGGTVAGLNNGQFEAGETVTLVATPAEGYLFKGWVKDGEIISTEPILSFVAEGSINLFAEFVAKPKTVTVEVEVNDETFGTVIGAGSYTEGDEVMLVATPAAGYEFVLWTKNGKPLSNLTTLYFTVVDDCTIEAEFRYIEKDAVEDIAAQVSIYPNPADNFVTIESDTEIANITLSSLQGTIVKQEMIDAFQVRVDVSDLRNGLYILTVQFADGTAMIQKVIVK